MWKKPLDFGGNPDHVTLRWGYMGHRRTQHGRIVFPGVNCLMVTILRRRRWRSRVLY